MAYHLPEYSPEMFAGRQEVIDQIMDVVQTQPGRNAGRVVRITGERGAGKTFLAMQLHSVTLPAHGLCSYLVHLTPGTSEQHGTLPDATRLTEEELASPEQALGRILREIAGWLALPGPQIESGSPEELSSWITAAIHDQPGQQYALICDSAFESSWDLLALLERYLLAPLASYPNVAIIITGRGQPYPWQSAFLRTEITAIDLPKFTETETIDALKKLKRAPNVEVIQPDAHKIHSETQGHPLMTVMRAQGAKWQDVINELMVVVKEKTLRAEVTGYMAALTPLDGFRDEVIEPMLKEYLGDKYLSYLGGRKPASAVLEPLQELRLVTWKNGKYHLDSDLRWALYRYLLFEVDDQTWVRLNTKSEKLYRRWSEEYPRVSKYFIEQADRYHTQSEQLSLITK